MDSIVFYFSPTGGTRKVAEHIAEYLGCGAADITSEAEMIGCDADTLRQLMNQRLNHVTTLSFIQRVDGWMQENRPNGL